MRLLILFSAMSVQIAAFTSSSRADTFGAGADQFSIDFVTVANAGNAADDTGFGGVTYDYRMATFEVSYDMIARATSLGMANVSSYSGWPGPLPAGLMTWYESAAFVNWLNVSKGYHPAYNLTYDGSSWDMSLWSPSEQATTGVSSGTNPYRHKDAVYVLPGEDEWYKSAYHRNDGVTGNYWNYAAGTDSVPDGIDSASDASYQAVFNDGYQPNQPYSIYSAGSASPYGTYGQDGNIFEWMESAYDGVNHSPYDERTIRGGDFAFDSFYLGAGYRSYGIPWQQYYVIGLRVASVPEPSTGALQALSFAAWSVLRKRAKRRLAVEIHRAV